MYTIMIAWCCSVFIVVVVDGWNGELFLCHFAIVMLYDDVLSYIITILNSNIFYMK